MWDVHVELPKFYPDFEITSRIVYPGTQKIVGCDECEVSSSSHESKNFNLEGNYEIAMHSLLRSRPQGLLELQC